MRTLLSLFILVSIIFFTSCGGSNINEQNVFIEPNSKLESNLGYLKVYTYSFEEKGDYQDDPVYEVYKGYSIYTVNGDHISDVEKSYEEPELVKLPAGEYIVVAEMNKNILNSFIAKVEKGKILEIDESMIKNSIATKN